MFVGIVYLGDFSLHMWESVKEIQYYCGRLDFRNVVDKHMVHFFGNIHKTNNVVVQWCFNNFKQVISLNVCAMSTVLLYMIICYLVVCAIIYDYSSNSYYFTPLSSGL